MSAHPNALLDSGAETMAIEKLTRQLEAGSIEPLSESVHELERQSYRRFNLEPIELFPDEANDHTMQQYWRPVEGWQFKDPQAANAQAREVLAHRYEQLSQLAILPDSASRRVTRPPGVVGISAFPDVQVPLERVVMASVYNYNLFGEEIPSWESVDPKSFSDAEKYLAKEAAGIAVIGTSKAIGIEYALRHYGRKTDWQEGEGMLVTLAPFIDSSGEIWFLVENGTTRITADKLVGRRTISARIEIPTGSGEELLPYQLDNNVAALLLGLPKDSGN